MEKKKEKKKNLKEKQKEAEEQKKKVVDEEKGKKKKVDKGEHEIKKKYIEEDIEKKKNKDVEKKKKIEKVEKREKKKNIEEERKEVDTNEKGKKKKNTNSDEEKNIGSKRQKTEKGKEERKNKSEKNTIKGDNIKEEKKDAKNKNIISDVKNANSIEARIDRLRNCLDDDNIFDFIGEKYKKHFLNNSIIDQNKNTGPFVFFESINAYELKKYKLSKNVFDIIFDMTKTNMEELYNRTDFLDKGWSDEKKMRELKSNKCKLILGFLNNNTDNLTDEMAPFLDIIKKNDEKKYNSFLKKYKLIAFVHYRLTPDYHPNQKNIICYLYEIQVMQNYTSLGIGKHFIDMLEMLCKRIKLKKIVCTVLKLNETAIYFYKNKCSFEVDENNPDNFTSSEIDQCEYEILKKIVST